MGRADQARPTPEKPSLAGADNSDGTPVPTAIPRASRYWASTRKAEGTRQESDFLWCPPIIIKDASEAVGIEVAILPALPSYGAAGPAV
jgi:hypothetical protein